ncbi:MAG: cation:proton antiporter, partial [Chloroflexi bacterium]|nr:cation:proton antiporter [Chloroflexota bacterium]
MLARALHLPSLLGYLVAGVAMGPHTLGLVENVTDVQSVVEFGVVLLLFSVGVEICMVDLARVSPRSDRERCAARGDDGRRPRTGVRH